MKIRHLLGALAMAAVFSSDAHAQDTSWFRYGPLGLTPAITLSNAGRDGNVFNETTQPRSDLTATVQPALDASLRIGRARLKWSGRADAIFFRTYSDQNTFGTSQVVRFDIPFNRLSVFIGDSYLNARERPALDIDVRARRSENAVNIGADFRVNPLTRIAATADFSQVAFAQDATADGIALGEALDRRTDRIAISLERALTGLTTMIATVGVQHEQFTNDPTRTNLTRRAALGLSFKPLALVTGRFDVGVLDLQPQGSLVPASSAPAVSADLGYTLLGTTHFGFRVDRSVSYSIDDTASYSIQTGLSGTVTHHIRDWLAITASAGRQVLKYQLTSTGVATGVASAAPSTVVSAYDAALAYQQGTSIRWGLHVDYVDREPRGAPMVGRFTNFRIFSTVTYGPKH